MIKKLIKDSIIIKEQCIQLNAFIGENLDIANNELKALLIIQKELKNDDKGYCITQDKEMKKNSIILKENIKKIDDEMIHFNNIYHTNRFDIIDL